MYTERDRTANDLRVIDGWSQRIEKLVHLYRYRSLSDKGLERVISLVEQSELFFPSYPELNDPFDGQVLPTDEGTDEEKRALMVDYLTDGKRALNSEDEAKIAAFLALPAGEQSRRVRSAHEAMAAKMGVVCLSESGTDLPMWAYYADSHRGVCLRFHGRRLLGLKGCTPPVPVRYDEEYPNFSVYKTSRFMRIVHSFDTKGKVWDHEKEWRIVRHAGRGISAFAPAALSGVILGCRIGKSEEDRIRELHGRVGGFDLLRARPADREFKLEIVSA